MIIVQRMINGVAKGPWSLVACYAITLLQAQQLIDVLGFDRADAVARYAYIYDLDVMALMAVAKPKWRE